MAYTALEKMRKVNRERFGMDAGPFPPYLYSGEDPAAMKPSALRFLHESCEDLLFDPEITALEERTGIPAGTGTEAGQIPHDMEMDLNRLCLERALEKFLDDAGDDDAFIVCYAFARIFGIPLGDLEERDDLSDAVSAFAEGLALYDGPRGTFAHRYLRSLGSHVLFAAAEEDDAEPDEDVRVFPNVDFAAALNARYRFDDKEEQVSWKHIRHLFKELSLEYQISNLNQVRALERYLNELGYSVREKRVAPLTQKEIDTIAPMEHIRWIREHQIMGWHHGDLYETADASDIARFFPGMEEAAARKALREQLRCHKLCMDGDLTDEAIRDHYLKLSRDEQEKDWKPFNSLLKLIAAGGNG